MLHILKDNRRNSYIIASNYYIFSIFTMQIKKAGFELLGRLFGESEMEVTNFFEQTPHLF